MGLGFEVSYSNNGKDNGNYYILIGAGGLGTEDVVSTFITPITHIVTQVLPIVNLDTKSQWPSKYKQQCYKCCPHAAPVMFSNSRGPCGVPCLFGRGFPPLSHGSCSTYLSPKWP